MVNQILFDVILRVADRHPLPQSIFKGTGFLEKHRHLPGSIPMLERVHGRFRPAFGCPWSGRFAAVELVGRDLSGRSHEMISALVMHAPDVGRRCPSVAKLRRPY